MATNKLEGPLLARYSEKTPPGERTGGRVFDELPTLNQTRGAALLAVHYNGETKQISLESLVGGWDDLRFPATAVNPPGQASDPDFDTTRGGWLFDAGGTETLFIIGQLPHLYKEGTSIRPHVHWVQENAGDVLWQLDYKWFNNGEAYPANFTTIDTTDKAFDYSVNSPQIDICQISAFPEIDGTGMRASSIIVTKFSRIGGDASDTYTGDALMIEFDLHYLSDGHGTQLEYVKLDP